MLIPEMKESNEGLKLEMLKVAQSYHSLLGAKEWLVNQKVAFKAFEEMTKLGGYHQNFQMNRHKLTWNDCAF